MRRAALAATVVLLGALWGGAQETEAPVVITTRAGAEMVRIPEGWFVMGSEGGAEDEQPPHRVWVDSFLMDRYEVTQEAYEPMMLANPSRFKGPTRPMEQVSWAMAAGYCNARSKAEGFEPCYDEETVECNFEAGGYRLPTEAEWEYACRAGSEGRFCFGDDEEALGGYAWSEGNSDEQTHTIGRRQPNAWGLYDMHGNVAEWCNDLYDAEYYAASPERNPRGGTNGEESVLRGGSFRSAADECRSARRLGDDPGFQDACYRSDDIGFRCVRRGDAGDD